MWQMPFPGLHSLRDVYSVKQFLMMLMIVYIVASTPKLDMQEKGKIIRKGVC